jgi:hypothetical protein
MYTYYLWFKVVDMRWGVRDDATDMHETTELCISEIRACQQLSAGPNFIVRHLLFYLKYILLLF